jgi:acetolactate synthase-1/2/3 large subunit
MHQERRYPERISGTSLTNPNFAEMAQLFGGFGARIDCHQDFAPAFNRAIQSGKPALIEILTDPEQISVTNTISSLRIGKAQNK